MTLRPLRRLEETNASAREKGASHPANDPFHDVLSAYLHSQAICWGLMLVAVEKMLR